MSIAATRREILDLRERVLQLEQDLATQPVRYPQPPASAGGTDVVVIRSLNTTTAEVQKVRAIADDPDNKYEGTGDAFTVKLWPGVPALWWEPYVTDAETLGQQHQVLPLFETPAGRYVMQTIKLVGFTAGEVGNRPVMDGVPL